MLRLALPLICLALPAFANDDLPAPLQSILSERLDDCAGFENGALQVEDGAITHRDLTGDGQKNWVLDEFHLRCSSAASMYCGTGGCNANFLVGDVVTTRLSKGWDVVTLGPITTVLVQIHGANCGGTGVVRCVEALTWDHEAQRFLSVAPPLE